MQYIFLLVVLAFGLVKAQNCPEPYGIQVYPNEQYCDKFYKVRIGLSFSISFEKWVLKFPFIIFRSCFKKRVVGEL